MEQGRNCQLYLVSPPTLEPRVFAEQLDEIMADGQSRVAAFLLNLPGADEETIRKAAEELQPVCAFHGVAFLLKDNVELALLLDADGVHVEADAPLEQIRSVLEEERILGVGCPASRDAAMRAGELGAAYVMFDAQTQRDLISWWQQDVVLPCVAAGGIIPGNCAPLVQAGADFLAVGRGIWQHPQGAVAAVQAFNAAITEAVQKT